MTAVHHPPGPVRPRNRALGLRPGRANHPRPVRGQQLHQHRPRPAGSRVHQHPGALFSLLERARELQAGDVPDKGQRRQALQEGGGCGLGGQAVRDGGG